MSPHGFTGGGGTQAIVAVVLWHRGRLALFQRSFRVRHDTGLWHCVTGYLEPGSPPREQALEEIREEAGLTGSELSGWVVPAPISAFVHVPWLNDIVRATGTTRLPARWATLLSGA